MLLAGIDFYAGAVVTMTAIDGVAVELEALSRPNGLPPYLC